MPANHNTAISNPRGRGQPPKQRKQKAEDWELEELESRRRQLEV